MIDLKLANRHAFVLKRCSSNSQVDNSINNQNTGLAGLIKDNKIVVRGERDLEGVTGSVPGARDDIDDIINKKNGGLDFDLLILPTTDRFTRAGSLHANKMLWDLEGAGITVYFAAEKLFSSDRMHRMILGFMFDAAQQTAVAISRGSTLGITNSFLEGRSPHAQCPPYALDRMYSADGKDLHIIRNQPDGTQQMLNPTTSEIIRIFPPNPPKGTPNHYIKQKNELVRLVPGDPARVAVVHLIHEAVHGQGRTIHSICKELNDAKILSSRGREWDYSVVRDIAFNPVYIGKLIRGQTTQAIYYKAAPGAPLEAQLDLNELRDNPRPRIRDRGAEEWMIREDPLLADFLPPQVRDLSRRAIEADLVRRAAKKPRAPMSKDRHRASSFILKGVLRSKQGNWRMSGRVCGRGGDHRYYFCVRSKNAPSTGNVLRRSIPATPLEIEILRVLKEVLLSRPEIETAIRSAVENVVASKNKPAISREQVEKNLARKQKQIAAALDLISGADAADAAIRDKLAAYRAEIGRLKAELAQAPQAAAPVDVDSIAQTLAAELQNFGENMEVEENETIRQMIGLLVSRMEVDLLTREVELELSLPGWLADTAISFPKMSVVRGSAWKTPNEAHQQNPIKLADYRCQAVSVRPVCFECRRLATAA